MPNKFDRKHLAVGHWGSTYRRVQLDETASKVRVWLQDKLITRGRWAGLYIPVTQSTSGVVACTCTKDTTVSADRECMTCHGARYAPGFLKVLRETHFWCSSEASSFTLTGCEVVTSKKANVISMSAGATTATVVTQAKPYLNPSAQDWEVNLTAYLRAPGQTATLEFSTDSGATWSAVTLTHLVAPAIGLTGSIPGSALSNAGNVMFRVTLTRTDSADLTPVFEIVRIRRVRSEDLNLRIKRVRPDFSPGDVLILRPWTAEIDSLEPGRGRMIEHDGQRTWTAPLDFFDLSLVPETPACRISDPETVHPFFQFSSGVQQGTRYVSMKMAFNDNLGIFTHQSFDERRAQDNEEPYSLVW